MGTTHVDIDRLFKDLGEFGRFQVILFVLLMMLEIPGGMNHLGQVFLAGSMDYTCSQGSNSTLGQCYYYDNATESDEPCLTWEYNRTKAYTSTLVSEFDLVCSNSFLQAMSQTIYMLGVLIGVVVFGALADRYGRHKILMVSIGLAIVSGTATAFMPTYWSFVLARMVVGCAAGANMTTLFVMVMEAVGGRARTYLGMMVQSFFGLGTMLMALMAYFITDYRHLQLAITLIYVIFITYYWLVPESLRWQLSENLDGMKTVRLMAKLNQKPCPENLDAYIKQSLSENHNESEVEAADATLLDLYRTPNLRQKTLNLQFNWFTNSFVYYGISLLATDLAGNIYINTFFSGLSEFVSCTVMGLIVHRFGRRPSLSFCLLLAGSLCFATIPIPDHLALLRTVLALIGKFFIAGSFGIVYVYSAELFPTVVRNVGVGSSSMCARVGGLIAPFVALLNKQWKPLPFIVFGGLAVVAGLLTLLLPETLNQTLPDTIEEGEQFGKGRKFFRRRHRENIRTIGNSEYDGGNPLYLT